MKNKNKSLAALVMVVIIMVAVVGIAAAITNGELDDGRHPMVGLMVAQDAAGNSLWRCSGTLLSPTVYLTAGHCTEAPAERAEIWFVDDVESDIATNGYPYVGEVGGTAYVHPDFDPDAFYLVDVGVVVLDEPWLLEAGEEYATLPVEDVLDDMKTRRGKKDTSFTAVGYGLQYISPVVEVAERVRMVAYPKLVQINAPGLTGDYSLLLSNNHSTGGTCFGDSGGPNFINDTLVVGGVTSFGLNGNCRGTGGVYRMDRAQPLDWVNGFLP